MRYLQVKAALYYAADVVKKEKTELLGTRIFIQGLYVRIYYKDLLGPKIPAVLRSCEFGVRNTYLAGEYLYTVSPDA